jgi:hypothetical protein
MTEIADNRILRVTRMLVYLIMGFVALAGTVVASTSVALPIFWTEAVAEIVKENPAADTDTLLPWLRSACWFWV